MELKIKEGFTGERKICLPEQVIKMEEEDPLMSGLHITDIGYYPRASHHYCNRSGSIREHVLIYCIEGQGWYEVDGKRYHASANQYFILPAGHPHVYASENDNPWTIYWLHFKGSQANVYAGGALEPADVKPSIRSRISDRINIFEEIFATLEYGYGRENLRYASTLLHHYLGSMRYLQQFRNAGTQRPPTDNGIIATVIRYMHENLEQRLTLAQLSQFTGYSPSYFSGIFKRQTGHSPLNYFMLMKMKKVCELLYSTDMKINQICYKVGIDDSYYLSRMFSKFMGVSPTEYRNSQKTG